MKEPNQYYPTDPRNLFESILKGMAGNEAINIELQRLQGYNAKQLKGYLGDLINFDNSKISIANRKDLNTFDQAGQVGDNLHYVQFQPSVWDEQQNKEVKGEVTKQLFHYKYPGYKKYIVFCKAVTDQLSNKEIADSLASENDTFDLHIDPDGRERFAKAEMELRRLGFVNDKREWITLPSELAVFIHLLFAKGLLKKVTPIKKTDRAVRDFHRRFFEGRYNRKCQKQFQKGVLQENLSRLAHKFTFLNISGSNSITDLLSESPIRKV